jgi:hypothetical protein
MSSIPWRAVLVAAVAVALAAGAVTAFTADFHEPRTIREVIEAAPNRRLVVLEGTVRSPSANRLVLTDSTGEIRLNTCPQWYRPLLFGARETVHVVGHLAAPQTWRNNQPVFLVYRIRGEYGTRLTLRHNDGVPLWHTLRAVPGRQLQGEIAQELAQAKSPPSPWRPWN